MRFASARTLLAVTMVPMVAACSHAAGGSGPQQAVAQWAIQPTVNPPDTSASSLLAVSCPSQTMCIAVGYDSNQANIEVTLAEGWNGRRWVIQPTPTPAGALRSGLSGVSCPTTMTCTAVGAYTNASGAGVPLAERWNGSRWEIEPRPTPLGASTSGLSAVSCSSTTTCTAVGGYTGGANTGLPLAERWEGSRWVVQTTSDVAGATLSSLNGVSCPSAATCTAVGSYAGRSGIDVTLAERWSENGGGWVIMPAPATGGSGGELSGVSCPTVATCTAVGGYTDSSGTGVTLAERWNRSGWAVEVTPVPPGATFSSLGARGGVACLASGPCTAVGRFNRGSRAGLTLAERWNGTDWAVEPSPNATGATGGGLSGVSCPSAVACTAVGGDTDRSGRGVTLAEQKRN